MTDHFVDTTKMVSLNPLPELVQKLRNEAPWGIRDAGVTRELCLIADAYRAGADQELEACCEWLDKRQLAASPEYFAKDLLLARRPKPPSLREPMTQPDFRALCAELVETWDATADFNFNDFGHAAADIVDRARTALATPPPEPPTGKELQSLWHGLFSHDNTVSSGDVEAIVRAALERWGQR